MSNFDENFMLWKRKKASLENFQKCCSGTEYFKLGQIFYLFIANTMWFQYPYTKGFLFLPKFRIFEPCIFFKCL